MEWVPVIASLARLLREEDIARVGNRDVTQTLNARYTTVTCMFFDETQFVWHGVCKIFSVWTNVVSERLRTTICYQRVLGIRRKATDERAMVVSLWKPRHNVAVDVEFNLPGDFLAIRTASKIIVWLKLHISTVHQILGRAIKKESRTAGCNQAPKLISDCRIALLTSWPKRNYLQTHNRAAQAIIQFPSARLSHENHSRASLSYRKLIYVVAFRDLHESALASQKQIPLRQKGIANGIA